MTAIKIDKNIPVLPEKWGSSKMFYPFPTMALGDSFLVPNTKATPPSRIPVSKLTAKQAKARRAKNAAAAAACKFSRHHEEFKFLCRITDQGLRIWRVAILDQETTP